MECTQVDGKSEKRVVRILFDWNFDSRCEPEILIGDGKRLQYGTTLIVSRLYRKQIVLTMG